MKSVEVGEALDTIELPVRIDQDSGTFEVLADADALPDEYFDSENIVDVQVVADNADGVLWVDHTSAMAVAVGDDTLWADPLADVPSQRQAARGRVARFDLGGVWVGELDKLGYAPVVSSRRGTNAPVDDPEAKCQTSSSGSNLFNTRLANLWPVGNTKAWARVDGSEGGMYQVADKHPNKDLVKLEYMHTTGGWKASSGKSSDPKQVMGSVEYLTIVNRYTDVQGYCQYYITYEPHTESGKFDDSGPVTPSRPDYGSCQQVSDDSQWVRIDKKGDSAYSVDVGVSAGGVLGVSLGLSRNYKENVYEVHYHIAGTNKFMCGSDADPAIANKVMEKRG
ncbi:MAG: hypothetical protein JWO76_2405 [Nocardioides sp.]|nr:hypothetical protein [Nocardioides sp.]